MKLFKKRVEEAPAVDTAAAGGEDIAADLDAVMRKYDRESNTRIWEGPLRWITGGLMAAFSLYCIAMTLWSTALPETRLSLFLACIVFIGFLTYPIKKGHVKVNFMPWYDIVLMLVGTGCFLYFAFNAMTLIKLATRIEPIHVVIGAVGILILLELCRRCVGLPILCVVGVLLVYTFYNQLSWNADFYQALKNIIYKLFYTTNGVIGTPVNVCYTYIVLFIIFGAFLERTGIMPPIMGAAAFLMAEYMGLPYATVAVKAILPAVLYFTGIFIAVHLEAKKLGLKGLSRDEMPAWKDLGRKSYLLLPLILLVWLVSSGAKTMQFSAAVSILAAVVVGFLNKGERLTPKKIFEALEAGARGAITVGVACAVAGMIAGCITVTGLASILINGIVGLAGNAQIIGLALTMVCCIILGMGVPTTANYCIMASTCAPILIKMGIPVVAAHFFVFYFGIVADITPPVALAAYAGSAIAKSDPMKTGVNATKLAIAAFIVPYIFAYSPALLFENVSGWWEVTQICISALLGIFGIAAALNGHLYKKVPWYFRLLLVAGGLGMMIPGTLTDVVGLALVALVIVVQYWSAKREKAITA